MAQYPQRPGEPENCRDYLRTGRCKYGESCKYHHPLNVQSGGGVRTPLDPSEPPFPIRPDEPSCQYYLKHGTCKFGQACKFHHPPLPAKQQQMVSLFGQNGSIASFMDSMLPQRPSEPDCIYFLRNGRCKYGASCKYHHPMKTNEHDANQVGNGNTMQIGAMRPRERSHSTGSLVEVGGSAVRLNHLGHSPHHGPTHILVTDAPIALMVNPSSHQGNPGGNVASPYQNPSPQNHFYAHTTATNSPLMYSPAFSSVSSYETASSHEFLGRTASSAGGNAGHFESMHHSSIKHVHPSTCSYQNQPVGHSSLNSFSVDSAPNIPQHHQNTFQEITMPQDSLGDRSLSHLASTQHPHHMHLPNSVHYRESRYLSGSLDNQQGGRELMNTFDAVDNRSLGNDVCALASTNLGSVSSNSLSPSARAWDGREVGRVRENNSSFPNSCKRASSSTSGNRIKNERPEERRVRESLSAPSSFSGPGSQQLMWGRSDENDEKYPPPGLAHDPIHGNWDDGLSTMTSALLNLIDTTEESGSTLPALQRSNSCVVVERGMPPMHTSRKFNSSSSKQQGQMLSSSSDPHTDVRESFDIFSRNVASSPRNDLPHPQSSLDQLTPQYSPSWQAAAGQQLQNSPSVPASPGVGFFLS